MSKTLAAGELHHGHSRFTSTKINSVTVQRDASSGFTAWGATTVTISTRHHECQNEYVADPLCSRNVGQRSPQLYV